MRYLLVITIFCLSMVLVPVGVKAQAKKEAKSVVKAEKKEESKYLANHNSFNRFNNALAKGFRVQASNDNAIFMIKGAGAALTILF